jgi:hypothetical protein
VNARDPDGYTPLGLVLSNRRRLRLEMTLLSLPDVDLENCGPDGVSALYLAVDRRRPMAVIGMIGAEVRGAPPSPSAMFVSSMPRRMINIRPLLYARWMRAVDGRAAPYVVYG